MLLSVIFNCYKCHYAAECHVLHCYVGCHYAVECHVFYCHDEGHYAAVCHF